MGGMMYPPWYFYRRRKSRKGKTKKARGRKLSESTKAQRLLARQLRLKPGLARTNIADYATQSAVNIAKYRRGQITSLLKDHDLDRASPEAFWLSASLCPFDAKGKFNAKICDTKNVLRTCSITLSNTFDFSVDANGFAMVQMIPLNALTLTTYVRVDDGIANETGACTATEAESVSVNNTSLLTFTQTNQSSARVVGAGLKVWNVSAGTAKTGTLKAGNALYVNRTAAAAWNNQTYVTGSFRNGQNDNEYETVEGCTVRYIPYSNSALDFTSYNAGGSTYTPATGTGLPTIQVCGSASQTFRCAWVAHIEYHIADPNSVLAQESSPASNYADAIEQAIERVPDHTKGHSFLSIIENWEPIAKLLLNVTGKGANFVSNNVIPFLSGLLDTRKEDRGDSVLRSMRDYFSTV